MLIWPLFWSLFHLMWSHLISELPLSMHKFHFQIALLQFSCGFFRYVGCHLYNFTTKILTSLSPSANTHTLLSYNLVSASEWKPRIRPWLRWNLLRIFHCDTVLFFFRLFTMILLRGCDQVDADFMPYRCESNDSGSKFWVYG